ncbi:MAG: hypothetical protein WBP61_10780 [Nocardioides sp.]
MRRTALPILLTLLVSLVGCGEGSDDPQTAPSSDTSPTATASTESTGSTEPTPAAPAVEPATGPLIDQKRIRLHAPEGWKRKPPSTPLLTLSYDRETYSDLTLGDLPAVREDLTLDQIAQVARRNRRGSTTNLRILDPVQIAEVDWYHLRGKDGPDATLDVYGTTFNGSQSTLTFSLKNEIPAAERQEIIDSVLASVEWK